MRNFHKAPLIGNSPPGFTQTCPRCHGSGRILRGEEPAELVALIPFSDNRLKPRRTSLIVAFSVLITAVFMGGFVYFVYPRTIIMKSLSIQTLNASIPQNPVDAKLFISEKVEIHNDNFVSLWITNLQLTTSYMDAVVGHQLYEDVYISARSSSTVSHDRHPI
eukprot:Sdes_comp18463_c0_seq2m8438